MMRDYHIQKNRSSSSRVQSSTPQDSRPEELKTCGPGFHGSYFIYDLPAMLLMQRFWLRRAGIPAMLGAKLGKMPRSSQAQIFLESSKSGFPLRLRRAAKRHSAFFGFYSFTEADGQSRARLRPFIEDFGVILLTFWQSFDYINNLEPWAASWRGRTGYKG
ncbi:unnamed protein product [Durusdinium trenchii]|uniref:Uncharacterized protein n=1 Tax=Durusdinium trenchii TaxID=1381693 RepID=A0ABP0I0J7_9DINO